MDVPTRLILFEGNGVFAYVGAVADGMSVDRQEHLCGHQS